MADPMAVPIIADLLAMLEALGRVYLWCLLALVGVCVAAAVIAALMGLRRGQQ